MNINKIATITGIQPLSLKRQLIRCDIGSFSLDEELPIEVIEFIESKRNISINDIKQEQRPGVVPTQSPQKKVFVRNEKKEINLISILQSSSLPMLGLAASYGVYVFSSHFFPPAIAMIEASAFELTYIGLSTMKGLSDRQKKVAKNVSIGALVTSVIYNTLAGALIMKPEIFDDLNVFCFWLVALIHGAPLAILGYSVSTLVFNSKK